MTRDRSIGLDDLLRDLEALSDAQNRALERRMIDLEPTPKEWLFQAEWTDSEEPWD